MQAIARCGEIGIVMQGRLLKGVWLACMLERRRTACTMGLALLGLAAITSACRPSHASVHPSPILHPFAPADISSNNLLIREEKGETCRLLLADPSITMRACDLAKPDMCARRLLLLAAAWANQHRIATVGQDRRCATLCRRSDCIASTWLWGSSTCRYKRFDPTADTYSMSFSFLEVLNWVLLLRASGAGRWCAGITPARNIPCSCLPPSQSSSSASSSFSPRSCGCAQRAPRFPCFSW